MTLRQKPEYWTSIGWWLYRIGVVRVVLLILFPLYLVVGTYVHGVSEALEDWCVEWREVSR